MIEKIRQYIRKYGIAEPPTKAIVGLSGGIDSIVLTQVLSELGYDITAVHCNFNLRGKESERDENFVKEFCRKKNIELQTTSFNTWSYAAMNRISIEMAARELRYTYFEQIRSQNGNAEIFIAHHADDSLETMLLNLIRGTGLAGMCGIKPVNGHIMRPLLCVSRHEIEGFALSNGLTYVVDSTNLQNEYTRNKIRNELIPLLKTINPSIIQTLSTDMENFASAEAVYESYVAERMQKLLETTNETQFIKASELAAEPHKECILHEWLKTYGFNPTQTKQISSAVNAENGTQFYSSTHTLIKESGFWKLSPTEVNSNNETKDIDDILEISESEDTAIIKDSSMAILDAEKVRLPLSIRPWKNSDRFCPIGMNGKVKKVSDLLCELKIPAAKRDKTMVLISDNKIAWVVGYRIDERFKVTDQTRRILKLKIKDDDNT